MIYAKMIMLGTKSIYDAPLPMTGVVTDKAPTIDPQLPHLKVLSQLNLAKGDCDSALRGPSPLFSEPGKTGTQLEDIAGASSYSSACWP